MICMSFLLPCIFLISSYDLLENFTVMSEASNISLSPVCFHTTHYLLHALQSLLQEAELLRVCVVLLAPHWLVLALFLFEQLHLVPVGVQLAAQGVVLLL